MLECNVRCFVDSTGNIFNYRIFEGSTNDDFDQSRELHASLTLCSASSASARKTAQKPVVKNTDSV